MAGKEGNMKNNRGETLIEVVFSFAVIAVVVASSTLVINAANKIINSNLDGRRLLQQEVAQLHMNQNLETIEGLNIQYTYSDGTNSYSDNFAVEKVRVTGGSLQKYR